MKGDQLGVIGCPHCAASMKVKEDKNGHPFGHCESCGGQLRVGGSSVRVDAFFRAHPEIKRPGQQPAEQEAKAPAKPAAQEKPAAKKPAFSFFEQLNQAAGG